MGRRHLQLSFFILVILAAPLAAQPSISSVVNAASNIPPGLPNAAIAQGAIFTVFGTGLGPRNASTAAPAFQSPSLSGTSVAVMINGTKVAALMYYTSATQVAARCCPPARPPATEPSR